ncbi:hypothetical protein [Zoogloea sp.]|uniref:hypothetical protein n=1 Tax=Zoogloea sp. TaxID=49181 RepID=UPI00141670C9|nr:MAG: hypothetical protein F9K15_18940 [Zoogloea sp.]
MNRSSSTSLPPLPGTPLSGLAPAPIPVQETHLEDSILRLAPEIHGAACPPPAPGPGARPMTDVWHTTTGVRTRVRGTALHAALAWQGHFLLLMDDDSAPQGRLHLHLVSREFRVLDSASLATAGAYRQPGPLVLSHPNQIVFCFPSGGTVWRISLFHTFRLRLPRLSEPADVQRHFSWRRHFAVARID